MAQNLKKVGENLFCSDYVLQEALSHTHQFLTRLSEQVDFEKLWQEKLLEAYKGGSVLGAPPYPPALILKMLFLSYLFNISERDTERMANDSISFKAFLGLGLTDQAPDHSTLTVFKNRILRYQDFRGRDIFKEIFNELIAFATEKGVDLGFVQAIDSTHTLANVNIWKEHKRTKYLTEGGEGKKPRDPDAEWGVKKILKEKTVEGKKVKINDWKYGFKSHLSVNTKKNLITSYRVTTMKRNDGKEFFDLLKEDLAKGVATRGQTTYTADRAYDQGDNHVDLEMAGLFDAIFLKYVKAADLTPSGYPLVRWGRLTSQQQFEAGQKQRFCVERVNASLKNQGLGRARSLGLARMKIQTAMSSLAHNLKTLVKLWTGIGLRTISTAHVSLA